MSTTTYSDTNSLTEGFKQRLRRLAELVGSVNALAKSSGIAQSTIRKYFEKGEPPRSIIFKLADAAGVRAEWLLTGVGPLQAGADEVGGDVVWIPEYDVRASAGYGHETGYESVDRFVALRRDWLRNSLRVDPTQLCLIHIEGDSMEPTLRPGNISLVDCSDTAIRDGIFALNLDNALHVKRLHRSDDGKIDIISDNPKYSLRQIATRSVGEELRIVGRVVWADRKF